MSSGDIPTHVRMTVTDGYRLLCLCSLFQVTNDMQTMVQRMGSINLLQGHVQVNLVRTLFPLAGFWLLQ